MIASGATICFEKRLLYYASWQLLNGVSGKEGRYKFADLNFSRVQ